MTTLVDLQYKADATSVDKATESLKKNQDALKGVSTEDAKAEAANAKTAASFLEMEKAAGKVSSSLSTVAASFNPATLAAGALTSVISAFSLGAIKGMLTGVLDARVEMYHFAVQMGVTAEVLSALKAVAFGTTTSLSDIASLTKKFDVSIAASAKSTSAQAEALKNLNINARDANGNFKDTAALQLEVAQALNKHTDGITKDSYYMTLWGKQAVDNKEYLKKLGDQQELHGKLTDEQLKKAKELDEMFLKLNKSTMLLKNSMFDALLPTVLKLSTAFSDVVEASGGSLVNGIANIDLAFRSTEGIKDKLVGYKEDLAKWQKVINQDLFDGRVDEAHEKERKYVTVLKDQIGAAEALLKIQEKRKYAEQDRLMAPYVSRAQGSAVKPVDGLPDLKNDGSKAEKVPDLTKEILSIREKVQVMQGVSEEQAIINKFTDDYYKKYQPEQVLELQYWSRLEIAQKNQKQYDDDAYAAMVKKFKMEEQMAEQQASAMRNVKSESDLYAIQVNVLKRYGATQNDVAIAQNEYNLAKTKELMQMREWEGFKEGEQQRMLNEIDLLKAKGEELRKIGAIDSTEKDRQSTFAYGWENAFNKYKEDAQNAAKGAEQVFATASKGMEDALVNFVMTGKLNFADFAKSIIADITRIYVKQLILWGIQQLTGAYGGGGGTTTNFSTAAGISGGRASGGPVDAGNAYVVGENGPEILQMGKQSGTIIPNHQIKQNSSPVVVNNAITVSIGSVDSKDRQEELIRNIRDMVRVESMSSVYEALRRGNALNPVT